VGAVFAVIVILVILGIIAAARSFKVIQQYEKGVIYRFGQVLPELRGPGLHVIRPVGDRMQKVNMQIIAMAVPAQEGITKDNVTVRVDAVVYFRVVDPVKATINVQNYMFAVSQQAQTSLRSIIGQSEMDQLLAERESVNRELRRIIDEPTEGPWGIRVERVEIKDVSLPEQMKRSMSRQAEAERERRARIITADGEYQASKRLAAAANVMARDPAALQLRLLQTVVEVAGEKNSTLVMPVPVELLRFFVFQPFTLGVRLFGNMFAGHLLLTIFTLASWYLLTLSVGLVYAAGSFALAIFVFLLETLVTLLQAFIFTTLTATYIASSVEPAH